jgi:hypothetical protein
MKCLFMIKIPYWSLSGTYTNSLINQGFTHIINHFQHLNSSIQKFPTCMLKNYYLAQILKHIFSGLKFYNTFGCKNQTANCA